MFNTKSYWEENKESKSTAKHLFASYFCPALKQDWKILITCGSETLTAGITVEAAPKTGRGGQENSSFVNSLSTFLLVLLPDQATSLFCTSCSMTFRGSSSLAPCLHILLKSSLLHANPFSNCTQFVILAYFLLIICDYVLTDMFFYSFVCHIFLFISHSFHYLSIIWLKYRCIPTSAGK